MTDLDCNSMTFGSILSHKTEFLNCSKVKPCVMCSTLPSCFVRGTSFLVSARLLSRKKTQLSWQSYLTTKIIYSLCLITVCFNCYFENPDASSYLINCCPWELLLKILAFISVRVTQLINF